MVFTSEGESAVQDMCAHVQNGSTTASFSVSPLFESQPVRGILNLRWCARLDGFTTLPLGSSE